MFAWICVYAIYGICVYTAMCVLHKFLYTQMHALQEQPGPAPAQRKKKSGKKPAEQPEPATQPVGVE